MPASSPELTLSRQGEGKGKGQWLIRENSRLWKYQMRLPQHVGNACGYKEIWDMLRYMTWNKHHTLTSILHSPHSSNIDILWNWGFASQSPDHRLQSVPKAWLMTF
jgi:hypothetical protein